MTSLLFTPLLRRVLPVGAALLCGATLFAQTSAVAPRITQKIDDTQRTVLHNNTLPIAKAQYDKGAMPSSTPANRMMLVLKRSDAQERELKKLIADQHNPTSPQFHKWLKPGEFGKRFGVADSDVETVKAWLQAKGFSINKVSQGKTVIDMNGTAGQLKAAFHTELHTYVRNGVTFHANNKDPEIPTALAGVVKGFASLNDFRPKSDLKVMGTAKYDPKTHKVDPQWSYPVGGGVYLTTAPGDLAVQYNVNPVYSAGTKGDGETIGILSASNVDSSIVQNYRTLFNIGNANNVPNVIVDGVDPGQNGAAVEAYLDVEASAGMAPNATVNLYVGADTNTTSGLYGAMLRAVDDDVADVMSLSYGTCEQAMGSSGNQFFYYVWQQAAAQGQSVFVSAGDGGSAGCDDFDTESAAQDGLAVSGFSSTPYNTSVGGTDFYYSYYYEGGAGTDLNNQLAQYWNLNGQTTPAVSILQTIPEQPWNDSLGLNVYQGDQGQNIVAGSGGASSCAYGVDDPTTGEYDSCTGGYAKPAWQSGNGVPSDGVRDIPDVSLFAANGDNYSFYPICAAGTDCNTYYADAPVYITGVGGTSASSPATAGLMALIDQSQKGRQGNANFYFYAIAQQDPTAFNDVTNGSNNVVCVPGTPNCSLDINGDGYYSLQEYPATAGYDLASGLGTLNVAQLIADWGKVSLAGTSTSLSLASTSVTHGTPISATATVTANATAVTRPTGKDSGPTGSVALVTSSVAPNAKGQGTIELTDGTGTGSVILPGGSYSVTGQYSGDGFFAPSDSSPVSVTVTAENSNVSIVATALDINYNYFQVTSGGTYSYGDLFSIDADIAGASGYGAASGVVTYTDNGNQVATGNVNTAGVAELNWSNFTPGHHSVVAHYAGDASFNSSNSAPLTFTITPGTAYVYSEDSSFYAPVYAGQTFSVPVAVVGNSVPAGSTWVQPAAPTGSVTITLGSQTQTVALNSGSSAYGSNVGLATASFASLAAGSYNLTITYSGDSNYASATSSPETVTVTAPGTATTTTTLSASASPTANGAAYVSGAVTPSGTFTSPLPTGYVLIYDNGVFVDDFALDGVTNTFAGYISVSNLFTGTNVLTAQYLGDGNYNASTSSPVNIAGNSGDFSFTTSNQTLTIASGSSGSTTFYVSSLGGLQGTVSTTCAVSDPGLLCTVGPATQALTSDGKQYPITVTINTHDTQTGLVTHSSNSGHMREWLAGSGIAMALLFFGFPARKRTWGTLFLLLALVGVGAGVTGCGGGTNHAIGPTTGTNVPAGTYTATITASDSGVVHQSVLTVIVQ